MTTGDSTEIRIVAASVSDRGLNEKRPLNEDSFLSDVARGIFAVADGVGGAEAGEVASQTAVEVLGEAFRHQRNGDDVEDLMEIAIQRANASIHQMARESQHLAMMATTIVALHLDGRRATIGHVGDSRLYRIATDGSIHRETEDHSVVEEEVRAGRMTPEQARNHPSRNVISRALGAEASVEVDLKTMDVEPGTTFLLCSDGITRHISDDELSAIVGGVPNLDKACAELKRRCFERGAEDNLTAVLVRVGEVDESFFDTISFDEEQTIIAQRAARAEASAAPSNAPTPASANDSGAAGAAAAASAATTGQMLRRPFDDVGRDSAVTQTERAARDERAANSNRPAPTPQTARRAVGVAGVLAALFFIAVAAVVGFYAGVRYRSGGDALDSSVVVEKPPVTVATPGVETFETRKTAVDRDPFNESLKLSGQLSAQPDKADDPEFLYLYGRSLMRSGADREAAAQFANAVRKIQERPSSDKMSLMVDAYAATIAAHVGSNDLDNASKVSQEFKQLVNSPAPTPDAGATPGVSPTP
ncbi:MAG TPA: PP2C family serine/threonine-protein phosphatase [Pyrinomonadaceae bacterium]|nr:PP2C family serine/threonine-protein phosphatase [Pyrinomonadaceae bacterium]